MLFEYIIISLNLKSLKALKQQKINKYLHNKINFLTMLISQKSKCRLI